MSATHLLSLGASALMAAIVTLHGGEAVAADAGLRSDLERVAKTRVLFGHQSVGADVLKGLTELAAMSGVPLHIVDVTAGNSVGAATFGHVFVAENGKPENKLQSFSKAMAGQSVGPDVAMVKFCYVDIGADTDVRSLFDSYRATMQDLRAKYPDTTFVHITAPLTDIQRGLKATIKEWIGLTPYGVIENVRRDEYNALLREAYAGRELIFDLARVESTGPDGQLVTHEWNGKTVPALAQEYTDDGGHLNADGRVRAARELIAVLALAARGESVANIPLD